MKSRLLNGLTERLPAKTILTRYDHYLPWWGVTHTIVPVIILPPLNRGGSIITSSFPCITRASITLTALSFIAGHCLDKT
ncbi:hypothetical protein [Erwinia mallotivora]|uniref:hypothetical protein n=1 Tax=Erwinia mallotivora TaxID=69222 RepID=UPI0021BF1C9C|nr:hypothetical protein [Erwinia mallotivora]